MFFFNEFKLSILRKRNLYYILILIKLSFAGKFIDIKKLSISDIYFVVLDTGLYLHDFNTSDFALIHEFKENEILYSNNIINITELNYKHRAYIFCLVNDNLFILNEYTYKVWNYKINEISPNQSDYYNIMPYKIENNNISFIIAFNSNTTHLIFYFYNFNLTKDLIEQPKQIIFNDMNIQNKMIRCQINSYSTLIICFYYSILNNETNFNLFVSTIFQIENLDLFKKKNYARTVSNEINEIKVATSNNSNFFVCFLDYYTAICLINDDLYDFEEINCTQNGDWKTEYKVLYFKETDDFMLISRLYLSTTILSNNKKELKKCKKNEFSQQNDVYSIIYNNGYQLVNYNNFACYNDNINISIFASIRHYKYIKEVNNLVNNSGNKEDLITNLNEFIKNDINIDYIDDNEELIITKDEMTIAFTSTFIQKMNENSNSTTVNLGKCEKVLKNIYNISEESNLYMLKIDVEQEGKNYPLIE